VISKSDPFSLLPNLLHHLAQFIPVTLFGWLLLVKEQMSLGDLAAIKTGK
jgi:hypothetical protein